MGALASYAGQIFNKYIGFGMNILSGVNKNNTSFNIFGFKNEYEQSANADDISYVANYYMIGVITVVILSICCQLTFIVMNNYTLEKSYGYFLVTLYGSFFVGSLIYGILTIQ